MTEETKQQYSAVRLAMAGLMALAVAMGVGRFAFTPLLPLMQADAGLSLTQASWLASANYLGYLLGALAAAFVALGPITLLRWGLVIVVLVTALMGFGDSGLAWLVWRFVAGMASAWVLVATSALCLARLGTMGQPDKAGIVFAGVGIGMAAAGLLTMLLGFFELRSASSWLVLAALSALALTATLPLWRTAPAPAPNTSCTPPAAQPTSKRPATETTRPGRQTELILCYGLFGFGYILPATFIPAQARELVADPAVFGLAWPIFGIAAAISTWVASSLAKRWPRRTVWAVCHLIMAVGVLAPALYPSMVSIVLAALCVGGTFMVITMAGMQEAQAIAKGGASKRLIGALSAAFAAGQLAGPLVFNAANHAFGATLESSLVLAALALVAGALILLKTSPNRKVTT